MQLLKNRQFVNDDNWNEVSDEQLLVAGQTQIISLARLGQLESSVSKAEIGVVISSEESIDTLLAHLDKVTLVVVRFEALRDGRGFSFARLLRRAGFTGEIRAMGEVSRDRLAYLERCGFDSVLLPLSEDVASLERAYTEIGVRYQASQDIAEPIYRQGV